MESQNRIRVDLHIHSNASDGSLAPSDILGLAHDLELGAIAITDHDSLDGSKAALANGIPQTLKFLTGIEISANPPQKFSCSGSFHILGYAIDLAHPELNRQLEILQKARKTRNPRILERLRGLGISLSIDDLRQEAGQGQIGRPHIAQLMIKKGFARSISDAFDTYLAKGKPAYVDKYRMEYDQAIRLITQAGGIPVLAHPVLLKLENGRLLSELVPHLIDCGLKGLEVYYPEHSDENTKAYLELAREKGLLMTGGTDFHGELKPDIQLGCGRGDFWVPYRIYERLMKRI